jgi:NitT/TauT family transport system substrate-binding protein
MLIAIGLLLPGCQGSGNSGNNVSNAPQKSFKVAKCTHAVGLCNLPMFVAKEAGTTESLNVHIELINIPNWGDHAAALTSGTVDFAVTPFTNVMTAYANGAPIKIVAGSGINGLHLVASRDVNSVGELKGKRIGTFQADTLEMLLYSLLKKHGLKYDDVSVVYFTDAFELVNAFGSGAVEAMTHVEPYVTRAVQEFRANRLASGEEIWGGDHPDCVLTASERIIRDDPELVKVVILGMLRAQIKIENDVAAAVKMAVGKYYKADEADIIQAAKSQPPGVDIRGNLPFMHERFEDLRELGYVQGSRSEKGLIDMTYLQGVIAENPELYQSLKFKMLTQTDAATK